MANMRTTLAMILASLLMGTPRSYGLEFRDIVIEEASKLINGTGKRIFVVGSATCTRPNAYKCPLLSNHAKAFSDVDLRFAGASATSKALYEEYDDFYKKLKRRVYTRLDSLNNVDAATINRCMDSVNLYAPDELTGHLLKDGTASTDDYVKELKRLHNKYGNETPFHHMNFGLDAPDLVSYKPYIQAYEETDGIVIYYSKESGKVFKGITTLDDYSQALFSSKGLINSGRQFLTKSAKCLKQANGKDVAKNLARVRTHLLKSKRMCGFTGSYVGNKRLDTALDNLKRMTSGSKPSVAQANQWLRDNRRLIEEALETTKFEFGICKAITQSSGEEAIALRKVVQNPSWRGLKSGLMRRFRATRASRAKIVKSLKSVGQLMTYLCATADGITVLHTYKTQGVQAALNRLAQVYVDWQIPIIPIARLIFEMGLDEAKALGAHFAVSRQDCEDLLAGIVAVTGREHVGEGMQIGEAARKFIHGDTFIHYVRKKIDEAAKRKTTHKSEQEIKTEQQIAATLTQKCLKLLFDMWSTERRKMLGAVLDARAAASYAIENTPARLFLDVKQRPLDDSDAELIIAIACDVDRKQIHQNLVDMQERIRDMGGEGRVGFIVALQDFRWWVNGKPLPMDRRDLSLAGAKRDAFMGLGYTKRIVVPRSSSNEIELRYGLYFTSINTIAPEVMKAANSLKHAHHLKAAIRVDPIGAPVYIDGPKEILAGEQASYTATVPDTGEKPQITWRLNANTVASREVGTGMQTTVEIKKPGTYEIVAMLNASDSSSGAATGRAKKPSPLANLRRLTSGLPTTKRCIA